MSIRSSYIAFIWGLIAFIIMNSCDSSDDEPDESDPPQVNEFTDERDGKTYKFVQIGDQVWMAENLAFDSGGGNWILSDDQDNLPRFGYLYDWETAMNACPSGWHLPSEEEWLELADQFGGIGSAGGALKDTTTVGDQAGLWLLANIGATNESGFTGLPGGRRLMNGNFLADNNQGNWWSATVDYTDDGSIHGFTATYVWKASLDVNGAYIGWQSYDSRMGFSVRCIRD